MFLSNSGQLVAMDQQVPGCPPSVTGDDRWRAVVRQRRRLTGQADHEFMRRRLLFDERFAQLRTLTLTALTLSTLGAVTCSTPS